MGWFLVYMLLFSLRTKYQQHNTQGLCNKSFFPFPPSMISLGSVVLILGTAQNIFSQPVLDSSLKLQKGPRLRDWSWWFGQHRSQHRYAFLHSSHCAHGQKRCTVPPQRGSSAGPTRPTGFHHDDSGRQHQGAWIIEEWEGAQLVNRYGWGRGRKSKAKTRRLVQKGKENGHCWRVNTERRRHAKKCVHDDTVK